MFVYTQPSSHSLMMFIRVLEEVALLDISTELLWEIYPDEDLFVVSLNIARYLNCLPGT